MIPVFMIGGTILRFADLFNVIQKFKGTLYSTSQTEENEIIPLELLEKYKHLRKISSLLHQKIIKTLHQHILFESGKKLGLYYKHMLYFECEEEASVLFDYAIYHHRIMGRNAIERYKLRHENTLNVEEKQLLEYSENARFALLKVKRCFNHGGVIVFDMFRNEQLLLIDEGLSKSAIQDLLLLANIIPCGSFHMTTGASIPLTTRIAVDKVMTIFLKLPKKQVCHHDLPKDTQSNLAAKMIKHSLEGEAMKHTVYAELT